MFARSTQRLATRNFQTSARTMGNKIYATPAEGRYTNIPFKVKNRKTPLALTVYGVLGFFFAFPFLTSYYHLKKAGSFDM